MGHRTEEILRIGGTDELVDRGLQADEDGDIELAERLLDEAGRRLGENNPRVLHLAGRVAWAHGDIDRATGFLQQATDQKPERPEVYIDCARCLHIVGDDNHAEEMVRTALGQPRLDEKVEGDARVLLSQIRLEDDDPEEALEVLEAVPASLKDQALYLATLADVLVELERTDEALELLARAVEAEPDDPDYHYQRGLTQQSAGDVDGGSISMMRVLELETALRGQSAVPTFQETQALRGQLEEAMEELPDPILGLVANTPITVQAAATVEQVKAGADPRSPVFFVGRPKLEGQEAELTGIVVARDVLVDEVDDEDEIAEALLVSLVEEITDFFGRDDLLFAEASA
jgi:tetratricopeptide (TPR) repeat protein